MITNGLTATIDVLTESVEMPAILSLLHDGSYSIRKVERQTASLEEIFMKVAVIE